MWSSFPGAGQFVIPSAANETATFQSRGPYSHTDPNAPLAPEGQQIVAQRFSAG